MLQAAQAGKRIAIPQAASTKQRAAIANAAKPTGKTSTALVVYDAKQNQKQNNVARAVIARPSATPQENSVMSAAKEALYLSHCARHPSYHTAFEASFGNLPVPRPFHSVGTVAKVAYPKVSTGYQYYTLAPGESVYIYPTPYHGINAFDIVNSGGGGAATSAYNFRASGTPGGDTFVTGAVWRQWLSRIMQPSVYTGVGDNYGHASINPILLANNALKSTSLSWAQLLGGSFDIEVSTPYNGQAVLYSLHSGENSAINGHAASRTIVPNQIARPQGYNAIIQTPSVPLDSYSWPSVPAAYGSRVLMGGNLVRNIRCGLPQDRSWYQIGCFDAATDGITTNNFDNGFAPTKNPTFGMQYGMYSLFNSGSVAITYSVRIEATFAATWPDPAVEEIATNDTLRAAMIAQAKTIVANTFTGAANGVRRLISNGTANLPVSQATVELRPDDHHLTDEATAVAGGAALAYQTGALSKGANAVKSLMARGATTGPATSRALVPYAARSATSAEGLFAELSGGARAFGGVAARYLPRIATMFV